MDIACADSAEAARSDALSLRGRPFGGRHVAATQPEREPEGGTHADGDSQVRKNRQKHGEQQQDTIGRSASHAFAPLVRLAHVPGGHHEKAGQRRQRERSEEHTSELQSLMRISYAVFCLKKKKITTNT